jgi:hypothetical protein
MRGIARRLDERRSSPGCTSEQAGPNTAERAHHHEQGANRKRWSGQTTQCAEDSVPRPLRLGDRWQEAQRPRWNDIRQVGEGGLQGTELSDHGRAPHALVDVRDESGIGAHLELIAGQRGKTLIGRVSHRIHGHGA